MVKALFDSNILIDQLLGIAEARREIALYDDRAISIVTWIELLVGATPANLTGVRAFLESFQTVELDRAVAEETAALRSAHRIKLPDAVVWASARIDGRLLVTRNTKDFPAGDPGIRHPYVV
ncbi:MAG TPA: type II toxin-antitoxin system VapC family toxin [Caulobacteraceae bacterium]|nr:type II toxin-antitoxin system VapC family toxin [Caulobacteraceae bacterium]